MKSNNKARFLLLLLASLADSSWASTSGQGPRFVREPPPRLRFHNSTGGSLECSTRGHPTPELRWLALDDTGVVPGTPALDLPGLRRVRADGSLEFLPFRADQYRQDVHSATYRCLASNRIGVIGSRDVHVRAVVQHPYKPQVYDEFVIAGNTAVFRCSVPSFVRDFLEFFAWIRDDGTVITSSLEKGRYSILPTGELYVRHVESGDRLRSYRCRTRHKLTNEVVTSASSGRLIIQEPQGAASPKITDSHPFVHAVEGQDAIELACAAQGYPIPSYRWYRELGGRLLDLTRDLRTTQTEGSLLLSAPLVKDSGKYFCVVNNSVGEEQVRTTLSVTAPLKAELFPAVQTADVGQPAVFNCTVTGHPVRSLSWYKDQRPLEASARVSFLATGMLRISTVLREDAGMYQCYVHNEADSAQGSAELRLGDVAPFLTSVFDEQTLQPGASVSLRCSAAGNPLPQVTWTLDDAPVPDFHRFRVGDFVTADSVVVSFVNVTELRVEDGGLYACAAANAVGEATHGARVNVHGPPVIRPMNNISVVAGTTLRVVCPVAGYPIHSVTWFKGDAQLPTNHRQQIAQSSLSVHNVQRASDEGEYSCLARSGNLSARGNTFVRVRVPPVIDSQMLPDVLTANEGMNVKMLCSVVQGDPPITLRWTRGGRAVARSASVSLQSLEDSSVLTMKGVSMRDSGNYTCEASNRALAVNRTVSLVVNVPPMWTTEPSNGNVVLGGIAALHCAADGFPTPRIDWKRAQGSEPRNFRLVSGSYRIHVHTNGTLVVQDAELADGGYYLCEAHNGIGVGLSRVVTLAVNVPPSFPSKFTSQNVKRGQDTVLRCEAAGDPDMTITWEKDKHPLDLTAEKRYTLLSDSSVGKMTSTLTIKSAERRDGALYTCIVRNPYGSDETNIQLLVQEAPSSPADVRAMKISSRTIEITWSPSYNGNSPIRKYHVHFTNTSWDVAGATSHLSVPGTENRAIVYKLLPMTTYRIKVVAENALGHSAPSDTLEVTTSEEAPGGPPLHVKVEATGSQSLKVTWEPPRKELQHGKIQGYYIGYKEEDRDDAEFQYKNVEALETGGSRRHHMSHLTNLKRKTSYVVKVQAYNSEGAGPMSDDMSATTLEAVPPTSPALIFKTSTTSSVTVEWERYPDDMTVRDYVLHYQAEGGDWQQKAISTSSNKFTLEGLKCGSLYSFYMTATNSLGTAEPRDIIYGRTRGAAPVSSKLENFIDVNATSATLRLDMWQSGGCPILHFVVHLRPSGGPGQTQQQQQPWKLVSDAIPGHQRHFELRHLSPGREYEVRVSAHSDAGTTEADYSIRTLNRSHMAGVSSTHGSSGVQAGDGGDVPLYRNLSILLPVSVSVLVLIVVVALVMVCFRRQNDAYSAAGTGDENHMDDPLRKCQGSTDSMSMTEFCAKKERLQQQDAYGKATSYYASPTRKPVPVASGSRRGRRGEDGHEYAEPYAALQAQQQRLLADADCAAAVAIAYRARCEGAPYATIKRSPPRSHIAGYCQEIS
ncbi:Down syndrome cell adhesion molecule-like protein Dscam2 [Dermacentor silvarum]|uniref:Down syndrome cell adhesion molecule-like protein Dscam2 n=1 Tax=Dermacentor silvarum TaxID=543639 RepID=UPI0021016057|nr:Down syndrome cell adhesion molecule-like protein Dscam2 [Dermacentor silvarum]